MNIEKRNKLSYFLVKYGLFDKTTKTTLKCFENIIQKFSCFDENLAQFWSLNHINWDDNVFICSDKQSNYFLIDYLGNKLHLEIKGEYEVLVNKSSI